MVRILVVSTAGTILAKDQDDSHRVHAKDADNDCPSRRRPDCHCSIQIDREYPPIQVACLVRRISRCGLGPAPGPCWEKYRPAYVCTQQARFNGLLRRPTHHPRKSYQDDAMIFMLQGAFGPSTFFTLDTFFT